MNNPEHYANRWPITIAVMLAAVIEVLDMTIVNVAMPQMMGSLSATADQITWVLTSYIVSSAIVMLLTGFLVTYFGRKKLLVINVVGFLIASMLCGVAQNLLQIVFFRTLQGIFGASLIPLSQYILRDTFSKKEQGMAMAIWGTGIMAAPVLGPTLGGYITDILSWRWVFYINIPVCIISLIMTLRYIPDSVTKKIKVDWLSLGSMCLGVGCLQIFLDRGNSEGWFDSNKMILLAVIALVALVLFTYRGIFVKKSMVNLRIFGDRNFANSSLMLMVFCAAVFALIALQPIMMERLLNYPVFTTGLMMMPRGLASAVMMIFAGRLMEKYDPRIFITLGVVLSAIGAAMMCRFNLAIGTDYILLTMLIQGLGMGLFFVPISALSMMTLKEEHIAEATGLFSFARSLGSSIGISVLSTVVTREGQASWNTLAGHVSQSNPNFSLWLQQAHLSMSNPKTIAIVANTVSAQSHMLAYLDAFWFTALSFLVIFPLIFTLKKTTFGGNVALH